MYSKNECRQYINEKRTYLNLSAICRELNIKMPHLSRFLMNEMCDHYLNVERANAIVQFIEKLPN